MVEIAVLLAMVVGLVVSSAALVVEIAVLIAPVVGLVVEVAALAVVFVRWAVVVVVLAMVLETPELDFVQLSGQHFLVQERT